MADESAPNVLFEEVQYFRDSWMTRLVLVVCIVVVAVNVYGLYLEFSLRQMIGMDTFAIDWAIAGTLAMILMGLVLGWLALCLRLRVSVTSSEVLVELLPIIRRSFGRDRVTGWVVEGGGESAGRSRRIASSIGWAAGVKGDAGVMLELEEGKNLRIGVRDTQAFAKALAGLRAGKTGG